ncbi:hypothetical protein ABVK25_002906 [Lepraria finkii]|uniref:Uncharacterized protein n=1 Tax=Lepraria finkii TaxID=1340010 RepID=A0ABR4BF90_9LECA
MSVTATGSTRMAYEVAKALLSGRQLDHGTTPRCPDKCEEPAARSSKFCDNAEEVSKYGAASLRGFKDAGTASWGSISHPTEILNSLVLPLTYQSSPSLVNS